MRLETSLWNALFAALKDAYPTYEDLALMLRRALGINLHEIKSPNGMDAVVFKLITWAESHGRVGELVIAARDYSRGNAAVRDVARRITIPRKLQDDLERIILKNVKFNNIEDWLNLLDRRRRVVCRIECSPGQPMGSGFLVGPDVAITCKHVADGLRQSGVKIDHESGSGGALLRFDYLVPSGATQPGEGHPIGLATGCLIIESPVEELDFALMRLAARPGEELIGGTARGWLSLNSEAPADAGDPVVVLQHPRGDPMKLTFGSIQNPHSSDHRISYTANTDRGSSGSPCFNSDLEALALHRQGSTGENVGISLAAIRDHLKSHGLESLVEPQ